jgi:hypothetical protein
VMIYEKFGKLKCNDLWKDLFTDLWKVCYL